METDSNVRNLYSVAKTDDNLRKNLEMFKDKALELGASDARIIPASYVVVDERVWMKCLIPRCRGLLNGGSPYCPPHTPQPDFMRKVFNQYSWAVVFKREIKKFRDSLSTSEIQTSDIKTQAKVMEQFHLKTFEIVGRLEYYIQGEGYYLAMGLSGGSCRLMLCKGKTCGVIENGSCRFPLKARPSMEGVGIDVFDLASKVGWDIYMIRRVEPNPDIIPCALSIGIVFIC